MKWERKKERKGERKERKAWDEKGRRKKEEGK